MFKPNTNEMSFLDHLEALRWHIIRSLVAIGIIMIVVFVSREFIFDEIIFGPRRTDFLSFRMLCALSSRFQLGDALCITEIPYKMQSLKLQEQFLVHLKVSFILGFVAAFPYVFWEIWRFIKPALYEKERKYTRGLVFFTSLLFMIGVLFGYYIMTPFALNFLGAYKVSAAVPVESNISLESYIDILSMLVLSSGIVFQLPVVVYILSKIGLVTPELMRSYRKHAIVIILILSAVITPPDVTTQALISIPLVFLYEISIFISARVTRKLGSDVS